MVTPSASRVSSPEAAATAARTLLLLGWVLVQVTPGAAAGTTDLVKANNLTWKSTNFKTILEWEPKPINQTYTVQISSSLGDWTNKCYLTTDTECDVTDEIVKDVNQTYTARVFSYPLHGTSVTDEAPFINSPVFTPYLDTHLGRPSIKSFVHLGTKLNVTVQDALTLVKRNGTFLNLREVFGKDLSYVLHYWRASSTGRKTAKTNTNEFLVDADKEDYCFLVQAVIPSRKTNQKSPESFIECTGHGKPVSREMFFIIGAVVFAVIIIIILSVSLYKCKQTKSGHSGKENSPLRAA